MRRGNRFGPSLPLPFSRGRFLIDLGTGTARDRAVVLKERLDSEALDAELKLAVPESNSVETIDPRKRRTPEANGEDMFGAVESQLGLILKPAKIAVDLLVVDHAEKTPAAN